MTTLWIILLVEVCLLLVMGVLWADCRAWHRRLEAMARAGVDVAEATAQAAERAAVSEAGAQTYAASATHAADAAHEDVRKAIDRAAVAESAARRAVEAAERAELGTPAGALAACRELVRSANAHATAVSQIAEQVRRADESARAREKLHRGGAEVAEVG